MGCALSRCFSSPARRFQIEGSQRESKLAPRFDSSLERADPQYTSPKQLERRTGARSFAGSRTVEYDFLVAWDFCVTILQIFSRDPESARQLHAIVLDFHGAPQIHDGDVAA